MGLHSGNWKEQGRNSYDEKKNLPKNIRMVNLNDREDAEFSVVGLHIDPVDAVNWAREVLAEAGYHVGTPLPEEEAEWWDWKRPLYMYMRNAKVRLGEQGTIKLSIAKTGDSV
jgi:hypothetical protein